MTGLIKIILIISDIIFLNVAIILAFILFDVSGIDGTDQIYLIVYSNLTWLFLIMVSNPYNVTKGWSISKIIKSQFAFLFIHSIVVISLIFLFKKEYTWIQILLIYGFFVPSFFILRIFIFYLRNVFTTNVEFKNYILIGRNNLSEEIRKYYLMNPGENYKFRGYFDFGGDFNISNVQRFCEERDVHEIYYCLPNSPRDELAQLVNLGLDSLIKVRLIVENSFSRQNIFLDSYDLKPGIDLVAVPLDEVRNQFIKRVFDILFSGLFIISVLSWLVPLVGILIKFDSKGPVFFKQLRSGLINKPFMCLKFRSMKVNVDADTRQATKDDPRITKFGNFLRKSSIDELPQFLNVFMGSMSVVGPRPHMLKHTEEYSKIIEKFMGRHYIKPGITGLAQCMGYRGETKDLAEMENRVRLDRHYIENWSFWLDIKIIFLTIISLLRGSEKAY